MAHSVCELAARTILQSGMAPDAFAAVLDAFGPLPDEGQCQLAERVVGTIGDYRLGVRWKRPQSSKEKERLQPASAREELKRVLMIGAYSEMLPSTVEASTAVQKRLKETSPRTGVFFNSLDLGRFPGKAHQDRMARFLAEKVKSDLLSWSLLRFVWRSGTWLQPSSI
jgi:hypothetical protein